MRTLITRSGGVSSLYVVNPRRSLKSTVHSRRTPPSRSSSSVRSITSSTTRSGTKREKRSRTRRRSTASYTTSTASTAMALTASALSGATTGTIQPEPNAAHAAAANNTPAPIERRKPRS